MRDYCRALPPWPRPAVPPPEIRRRGADEGRAVVEYHGGWTGRRIRSLSGELLCVVMRNVGECAADGGEEVAVADGDEHLPDLLLEAHGASDRERSHRNEWPTAKLKGLELAEPLRQRLSKDEQRGHVVVARDDLFWPLMGKLVEMTIRFAVGLIGWVFVSTLQTCFFPFARWSLSL
jgi:hypothetical protein